jgi:hypothetical protein
MVSLLPIFDNGHQVVTFDTSSDDAEQENDDIDAGWEGEPDDKNISGHVLLKILYLSGH